MAVSQGLNSSRTGIESTFSAHSYQLPSGSSCTSRASYLLSTEVNVGGYGGHNCDRGQAPQGRWFHGHVLGRAVMGLNDEERLSGFNLTLSVKR